MKVVVFAGVLLCGILTHVHSDDSLVVTDTLIGTSVSTAVTRVSIESQPLGAAIVLDNIARGFTPDTLDSVAIGEHDLRLRLAGYYVKKARIVGIADSLVTYSYQLIKPATITITSQPDSAQVYIGGKVAGVTSFTDDKFKPGALEIVLKKSGFADTTIAVTIESGAADTFNILLKPSATSVPSLKKSSGATVGSPASLSRKDQYKPIAIAVFSIFTAALILAELMGP